MAVITTTYAVAAGEMTHAEAQSVVVAIALEQFPDYPLDLLTPVAVVAMRAVQLAAEKLGTTVPALLAELGAELSGPPAL
jgi:hypothetical protein